MTDTKSVLKPLTETQALYNTRYKYFGEDFTKVTCFSKPIFNPHKVERRKPDTRDADQYEKDLTDAYKAIGKTLSGNDIPPPSDTKKQPSKQSERQDALKRARDKVFEIAYANDFQYFVTLTLDETKISRTNGSVIVKALNTWFGNLVKRCSGFKYVFCPEYHADGAAIHFHGLLCGDSLQLEDSGTVLVKGYEKPITQAKADKLGLQGKTVYNLKNWKYGFSTAVALTNDKENIALYITKYITKDSDKIIGRYYYSGGKDLIRSVPTEYRNYPYCEFQGEERKVIDGFLAVKYKTF